MKTTFIFLLVLLFTVPVYAEKWVYLGNTQNSISTTSWYVDTDSIRSVTDEAQFFNINSQGTIEKQNRYGTAKIFTSKTVDKDSKGYLLRMSYETMYINCNTYETSLLLMVSLNKHKEVVAVGSNSGIQSSSLTDTDRENAFIKYPSDPFYNLHRIIFKKQDLICK